MTRAMKSTPTHHSMENSMNRMSLTLALISASTALVASPAMADDDTTVSARSADAPDSRQGFLIGGGIGPGFVSVSGPMPGSPDGDGREGHTGVSTDLTIGYGLTPQLTIFGMSRIVWFDMADDVTFSEVAGVGMTYYLKPRAPSLFVTAGLGWSVFVQPASDAIENQFGLGAMAGVGFEPLPHWVVEVDAGINNPGDYDTVLLMAKVNYLYY